MRLRNIPRAGEVAANSPLVVRDPALRRGRWASLFENEYPLHIEVGMGKGQFLTRLAAQNPQINYVGIERYTSVLLRALERLEGQENARNLLFLCMDARELPEVFAKAEVSRIYLNFSDPWPKDRHRERRLTSRQFLERYSRILACQGEVEFKTDNRGLFDFALEEARESGWEIRLCTYDLHADDVLMSGNVMTEYEEKFSQKGNTICKAVFRRPDQTV